MVINKDEEILVSISCITFNHAAYIKQCLDGFLMQECDFKFEVLIHDDASTDGTSEIIRQYQERYPEVIKPILQKENQYSKGVRSIGVIYNMTRAKGKYIAICEGDDFWIDKHKLQNQYEILSKNKNIGLTYTNAYLLKNGSLSERKFKYVTNESIRLNNAIPTLTSFFVNDKDLLEKFSLIVNENKWPLGDYPLWLMLCNKYEVKGVNSFTSVYRISVGTASRPSSYKNEFEFINAVYEIQKYFDNNKNNSKKINNRFILEIGKFIVRRNNVIANKDYRIYRKYIKNLKDCSGTLKLIVLAFTNMFFVEFFSYFFKLVKKNKR